jgi:hypothetical protein
MDVDVPDHSSRRRLRRRVGVVSRRLVAVVAALAMMLLAAQGALASTGVTVKDAVGLQAVGPTSSEYGFPAWYQDKANERLELCLDKDNPLCGFLPGDIPDETQPISFPGNFPDELFYFLASSTLDLPGGGRAVLTSGLEAAFVNGVAAGGQQTFTRIRVVVRGAPANQTITIKHPYGQLTIDTDGTGAGRLVRDVAPSVGNFSLALNGDVGPWLRWTGTDAPAGYLGDPAVEHTITGGPARNTFSLDDKNGTQVASTDQFTLQGKIATNTGVAVDSAVVNGGFVDVFATSGGSALEVVGQDGKFPTTIMQHELDTDRFYARVPVSGGATVTSVTVRNNGDKPASTAVATLSGIAVTQASYDGGVLGGLLTVQASVAAPATYPLTIAGVGEIPGPDAKGFPMVAPPATLTVASGALTTTVPVVVTGGEASPAGTAAPPVGPNVPPVCDPSPCGPGGVPAEATPRAQVAAVALTAPRGIATVIDGSTSTNATTFSTVFKSGPIPTIANAATNKPSVTLPTWAATADAAPRTPVDATPTVVTFTATNGAASSSVDVTLTPVGDTVTVSTARSRAGSDLRVDGTSTIPGAGLVLSPPTQVVVYAQTSAAAPWVRIGTSPVDTTGAFSVRPKPAPATAYANYRVQTSRGTEVTGTLTR